MIASQEVEKMIIKEDCSDFGYLKRDIAELGAAQRRFMNIPDCRINRMSLCGCSETCSHYEKCIPSLK